MRLISESVEVAWTMDSPHAPDTTFTLPFNNFEEAERFSLSLSNYPVTIYVYKKYLHEPT